MNGKDISKNDSEDSLEVINLDEEVEEKKDTFAESCVLSVVEYVPKNDRSLQKSRCSTNLYVKNFYKEFSDEDLR